MRHTVCVGLLFAALAVGTPVSLQAQTLLTIDDAMARARADTPRARATSAAVAEAFARVGQARSGFLPRVDVSESLQRGNQPVFVFSTLLSQRRFTAANFDVRNLNHPAPETNIRTEVAITQSVYDPATPLAVRAAELQHDITALDHTKGTQDLAFDAARAFVRVLQLESADRASAAAVAAADSDLQRVRRRRDAGLVTDADVLAVEVHLADVRQRQITTGGELAVARIELADALGLPLDQSFVLVTPVPTMTAPSDAGGLTRAAVDARPERRQAELRLRLAEDARRLAQSTFLPRVGVEGSWQFNGSSWAEQRAGWVVGASVAVNVFSGFADRARITEARQAEVRAAAEREQVERRIEVDVRGAMARVTAAQARDTAGRAALTQARESQRIIRDRYDAGLATVTDVLRAAEAVLEAEARATAAATNVILETVALNRAAGRL